MNKYNTHSDLAKESLDLLKEGKHYQRKIEKKEDFSIETYEFLEDTEYLKKGKYIEIFFKDHISNISEQITKILKEIQEKYSNKKGILLEVEDPDFAKNNKEKNIQEKRIKFYEKSKFKVLKNLRAKPYTVNFKIMIYELQKADIKEIENNIREFYYAVIDKKMQKYITVKNDLEDEEKKQKGNE